MKIDSSKILEAIKEAEKETSGEIRVHIQNHLKGDIFKEAKKKFDKMGMAATKLKNGVLFFIALKDRKFTVLGDRGINEKVEDSFWNNTVEEMRHYFEEGKIEEGIAAGVLTAGKALKKFFPYSDDDVNELSDEVSIDETE